MSSKTKTTATKEEAKPALLPKLRFPEFREAEGWKPETMSGVATVVMGSSPKSECYNESQDGLPLLQGNADIKNRLSAPRVFTSEITKECQIGDILMSVRAPVGSVAKSVHHACIGRGIAAIHAKRPNSQEFLYQWFLSYEPRWVNISQGGTFDAINSDDLRQVRITTPSPAEQKKIAECLSSVDDLIAAQARKVDAFKTHKKGLMQQLFPREGETQPRLRFPEFQNAGEWVEKRVDGRGNVLAGKALAVNAPGPLRPYLRTKNVLDGAIDLSDVLTMPMTDAEFSRFEVLDGDILLNEGQSLGLVGRASIYRGEFGQRCAMQNALLRFRAFPSTCPEFAAQAFQQCQKDGTFAGIATQTTSVAHLGSSRFSALELAWPPTFARTTTHRHVPEQPRRPDHRRNPKARNPQDAQERPDAAAFPIPGGGGGMSAPPEGEPTADEDSGHKKSEGRGLSGEPTITRHEAEFHLPMAESYWAPPKMANPILRRFNR